MPAANQPLARRRWFTAWRMSAPYTSELAEALAPDLLRRFERYVRIDTQSARDREQSPSTPGQLDLGRVLVEELTEAGLADAALDENGYVTATLPGNAGNGTVIGLIAHMDTSPDASGAGVEPIVHRDYDGERDRAARATAPGSTRRRCPSCWPRSGHDIVTSSGDTLLGADDKAGVAEIMAAVAHLAAHPELPRPTLRIAFTPDEEIGEGATLFDIERFGALCAYTMDGSEIGEFTGRDVLGRRGDRSRSTASTSIPATPPASSSARCGWPPRSSRRCPRTGSRPRRRRAARASSTSTASPARPAVAEIRAIVRDFDEDASRRARRAAAAAPREEVDGARAARHARLRRPPAVPQHARVHRAGSRSSSTPPRRRSAPRASSRCASRSAAGPTARGSERDGPADAEHLHRRPRVPLGARVGLGPGHGRRRGDGRSGWPRCGPAPSGRARAASG